MHQLQVQLIAHVVSKVDAISHDALRHFQLHVTVLTASLKRDPPGCALSFAAPIEVLSAEPADAFLLRLDRLKPTPLAKSKDHSKRPPSICADGKPSVVNMTFTKWHSNECP